MMNPLLICLIAIPGALLVLQLLSEATGLAYARWMRGVSRAFSLLMGCVCGVAVMAPMFLRSDTP